MGVEQRIGKIKASDTELNNPHSFRQLATREATGNLDAKCVVAQENVADSGNENTARRHDTSGNPTSSKAILNSSLSLIAPPRAVTGLI